MTRSPAFLAGRGARALTPHGGQLNFWKDNVCAAKNEETLRSLVAGSLLTRLREGPEVHRGVRGTGPVLPSTD
jgi:hypothetical protein